MSSRRHGAQWLGIVVLTTTMVAAGAGIASGSPRPGGPDDSNSHVDAKGAGGAEGSSSLQSSGSTVYVVHGADSARQRTAVSRTGVDLHGFEDDLPVVAADEAQASELHANGFRLESRGTVAEQLAGVNGPGGSPMDFPPGYEDYHNYDELQAEIDQAEADHGDIVQASSIGASYEGRDISAVKVSDDVDTDEDEPEVLFTCQQHAREILTREMCLRIINRLTDGYGSNPALTEFVDTREIYVIPTVNPDGAAYDIESGEFRMWRKNRQDLGTDLNRNWGHQWGCCGGSSGDPGSETYRGAEEFSAPETAVIRDFVNSRIVDGEQQIAANIDFHTYGELVLWPYGYTYDDTAPGLDADAQKVFQQLGAEMAATNGYTPQQSSDLYITDGSVNDWMWAEHEIWSYTFEMYGGNDGFYPDQSNIAPQTARNDEAVDLMLQYADCVPRIVGQSCE